MPLIKTFGVFIWEEAKAGGASFRPFLVKLQRGMDFSLEELFEAEPRFRRLTIKYE